MGQFGWSFLSGAVTGQGPASSIQFLQTADGELTGSNNFTYNSTANNLFLTGTMIISGTIQANTFDIIHTNIVELEHSGSTGFGNDETDNHIFTGSVSVVSGGMRHHYYKLTAAEHNVTAYDHIIGVSSSTAVVVNLPSASVAGYGRVLVIKDEWGSTRAEGSAINVSASAPNTIDHNSSYAISGDSAALTLYSDGVSKWFIY